MTKQQPAAQPTIAVSPYLSLRQAVRPLIFTYALLTREQERAGELAEECSRLRQLTKELLEAAALVHLLAPDKGVEVINGPGDKRSRQVIDAYAKTGLMWAEVTGSVIALADALMDNGRWEDVHRLAGFLDAADEPTVAQDVRTRAGAAAKRANEVRLNQIHPTMTEPEITSAIEALQESKDMAAVSFYLRDVASAILGVAPKSWHRDYIVNFQDKYEMNIHITWMVKPGDIAGKGQTIVSYKYVGSSGGPSGHALTFSLDFPALISELLIAGNSKVKGSVALAAVVEIPGPVYDEFHKSAPSIEEVSSRLDTLSWLFKQVQAENRRP
jgi:hypothetical protein